MAYEMKDGDINISKNKRKEGNQPDYRGSAIINGVQYEIGLWTKGDDFHAGTIKVNTYKKDVSSAPAPKTGGENNLPF